VSPIFSPNDQKYAMPKEEWRHFQQCLESSGDPGGNAHLKLENRWVDFPAGHQLIANMETPSA
jgi:hypothetical protein